MTMAHLVEPRWFGGQKDKPQHHLAALMWGTRICSARYYSRYVPCMYPLAISKVAYPRVPTLLGVENSGESTNCEASRERYREQLGGVPALRFQLLGHFLVGGYPTIDGVVLL